MKELARVPPKRTYGKKKTTATPAAAAIFGSSTESSCISQSSASSPRDPLVDITSAINNLSLTISEPATPEVKSVPQTPSSYTSPDLIHLNPLLQSYHADRGHTLEIRKWDQVFEGASSIVKIAEASYAEVYRITVKNVSSIIKVMPLRLPSDPPSMESEVAVSVEQVVSEIRIMNIMTEVPGFVLFKEAHLLKGKPSDAIISAWDEYNSQSTEGSFFPHPASYSDSSIFLVVELGDAGEVLEHFEVNSIEKLWDIFLGVVMALSRAENFAEFEHRDLHENNICISTRERSKVSHSLPEAIKFGRSNLEVTLIDYGLSRAKMPNGDVVFFDLESDLEVFRGEDGKAQFDTYRRMRTHLFTGKHTMFKRNWHTETSRSKNSGHTWAEYTPYSNVLWIKYLLKWLRTAYLKAIAPSDDSVEWNRTEGLSKLNKKLDVRTKYGAFESATDVLVFAAEQGWISAEQMESYGVDSSILSQ